MASLGEEPGKLEDAELRNFDGALQGLENLLEPSPPTGPKIYPALPIARAVDQIRLLFRQGARAILLKRGRITAEPLEDLVERICHANAESAEPLRNLRALIRTSIAPSVTPTAPVRKPVIIDEEGLRMVKVFLSHSNRDSALVERLVELLRSALRLGASEIRCTTIDGYRLPAGADTDRQLRVEIVGVPVFIGLVSEASFESAYVLFELGARWGTERPLIPLLAPGVPPSFLRGPLAGLNALSCSNAAQLHQLVTDIGSSLGIVPDPPASYHRHIEGIVAFAPSSSSPTSAAGDAVVALVPQASLRPPDIPEHVFLAIRARAERTFPDNFSTQEFIEKTEFEAYRRLQRPRPKGAT